MAFRSVQQKLHQELILVPQPISWGQHYNFFRQGVAVQLIRLILHILLPVNLIDCVSHAMAFVVASFFEIEIAILAGVGKLTGKIHAAVIEPTNGIRTNLFFRSAFALNYHCVVD